MPDPLCCRNKAEYAISRGKIGLVRAGSRELVPLTDCLLQRDESVRVLQALAKMDLRALQGAVTRVNRRGEVMLTLCGTAKEPPILSLIHI